MKNLLGIVGMVFIIWACQPEEEVFTDDPNLKLTYSTDTLEFDTLIANLDSRSRRVRIFNPNANAIRINRLGMATNPSPFRLIINGQESTSFSNIDLLGGDSLLVVVSANLPGDNNVQPSLIKDSLLIDYLNSSDHVKVRAWRQDAQVKRGLQISEPTVWPAGLPYLIEDFLLIDSAGSLTIEAGSKIFMQNGAGIFVQGKLEILGTAAARVLITSSRFDEAYEEAPGQWDGIYILEGSEGNIIQHAEIKNGTYGVRVGAPDDNNTFDVEISHTIIANMASAGILAFTSDVYAYNTLIYNCRDFLVGNIAGGNYRYEHCTFTNFPTDFFREEPSVQFSDVLFLQDDVIAAPLNVFLRNSIIWGGLDEELLISDEGNHLITLNITNNIIRSNNALFDVNNNQLSRADNYPSFMATLGRDYSIDSLSPAIDTAVPSAIITDLTGMARDSLPDLGAYEWFPMPDTLNEG